MQVPFDYVDTTGKRVDILFDMDLIIYADRNNGEWSTYALSDLGKAELEKYKAFRERKFNKSINKNQ
jgi:hypothetical protein